MLAGNIERWKSFFKQWFSIGWKVITKWISLWLKSLKNLNSLHYLFTSLTHFFSIPLYYPFLQSIFCCAKHRCNCVPLMCTCQDSVSVGSLILHWCYYFHLNFKIFCCDENEKACIGRNKKKKNKQNYMKYYGRCITTSWFTFIARSFQTHWSKN